MDVTSGRAQRYREYLKREQVNAAQRVGAKPLKHYAVSLNGFATTLTPDQARTLQGAPGVLSVTKDRPRALTDSKSPVDFLKLTGSNGVWGALGGEKARPWRRRRNLGFGVLAGKQIIRRRTLRRARPTASDPFGRTDRAKTRS